MVQTIKSRIKEKKESVEVITLYLQNMIKMGDHQAVLKASMDLKGLAAAVSELEWLLAIIQQSKKS